MIVLNLKWAVSTVSSETQADAQKSIKHDCSVLGMIMV